MRFAVLVLALVGTATSASADVQVPTDRTSPALATRDAPQPVQNRPAAPAAQRPSIEESGGTGPVNAPDGVIARMIRVDGADDLPRADLDAALASFVGHRLSRDDLRDLLATVSGVAHAQGFIFARSSIPAQDAGTGVLRLVLDKGRIDAVRLTGSNVPAVQRTLAPLVGSAPRRAELERQIALAGDLPGVTIGRVSYVHEGGQGILVVPVAERRLAGRAVLDNRGLRELGPERFQLSIDANGVLGSSDVLTVGGLISPLQPRELGVVTGRYAVKPNASGTEVSVYGSYGRTRSGGYWRAYDLNGASTSVGLAVMQPIVRNQRVSLWVAAAADFVAVDQWVSGEIYIRDRVATATASLNGSAPVAGGRLRARVAVVQGLGVLGATASGDPLASRPGAGGRFTMATAWANWSGDIGGPFSASLSGFAQLSTSPLLSVEQMDLGGPLFGRAYDYAERSGDQGVAGSAELQAKLWNRSAGLFRYAQGYVFADAGTVGNLRNDLGTGTLVSAGLGARVLAVGSTWLELESAFPVNADRYGTGDKDPRFSFVVTSSF